MQNLILCLALIMGLAQTTLAQTTPAQSTPDQDAPKPVLTILFAANSFGEYKPCPS
jgi:hypothetical protein